MQQEERNPQDIHQQTQTGDSPATGDAISPELFDQTVRERDEFRVMAQRERADFINYKRRTEEERQMLVRSASSRVILQLLPIVDDFQRAVDSIPADAPASWAEGVRIILKKLRALLENEGVTAFEPEPGAQLNPAEHDALFYEVNEAYPPGAIARVLSKGYRMQDRVIRPAQVVVVQS